MTEDDIEAQSPEFRAGQFAHGIGSCIDGLTEMINRGEGRVVSDTRPAIVEALGQMQGLLERMGQYHAQRVCS